LAVFCDYDFLSRYLANSVKVVFVASNIFATVTTDGQRGPYFVLRFDGLKMLGSNPDKRAIPLQLRCCFFIVFLLRQVN